MRAFEAVQNRAVIHKQGKNRKRMRMKITRAEMRSVVFWLKKRVLRDT